MSADSCKLCGYRCSIENVLSCFREQSEHDEDINEETIKELDETGKEFLRQAKKHQRNNIAQKVLMPYSEISSHSVLVYKDANGKVHRMIAIPAMYHSTFDYYLLSYCQIKYCLTEAEYRSDPQRGAGMSDEVIELLQANKGRRNKYRKELPAFLRVDTKRDRYPNFAHKATEDMLGKYLVLRRNAQAQMGAIALHTSFLELNRSKEDDRTKVVIGRKNPGFELEDYFFYEFFSGACLAAELTAALLEIENEWERETILEQLKVSVLPVLAKSPMFLTRNALARYYVTEAHAEINQYKRKYALGKEISAHKQNTTVLKMCIDRVIERLLPALNALYVPGKAVEFKKVNREETEETQQEKQKFSYIEPNPVCRIGIECVKDAERRLDFMQRQLRDISKPICLETYCGKPVFGPMAFCNTVAPGVSDLIKSGKELKKSGEDKKGKRSGTIPRNRSKSVKLFCKVFGEINGDIPRDSDALEHIFLNN